MQKFLTRQQIFDRVARHLLRQKTRALNAGDACVYRTVKDGKIKKCAIGALIPRRLYNENLELSCPEGTDAASLRLRAVLAKVGVNIDEDAMFLASLQRVHDHSSPSSWRIMLRDVAHAYQLNVQEVAIDAD